jgi:23S rRNA (guanosine2251-2'-O)-methyltransferase
MFYQNPNNNNKRKHIYNFNRNDSVNHQRNEGQRDKPSPLRVVHDRKPTANIIAGRNPVLEALRGGTIIEKVVILGGVRGSAIERIKLLAKRNKIPCVEVGKSKFRELVSDTTTQGVVAIVGTKRYVEVTDILAIAEGRSEAPFVLLLDEIEDPHNLGALIRTAECAGVHGIVIPKHHAASVNQTVSKTSAGASEHLPVAKVTNIANTLDELKEKGIWIVGTDSSAEKLYTEIDYSIPIAFVIGNEGKGIRQLVKEKCDFMVKIPLFGKVESLNASVAGAIIMYEIVKKRKFSDGKLVQTRSVEIKEDLTDEDISSEES